MKYELHQAKRGLMVILKIFVRYISALEFIDFGLIPLKITCYSILQKRLSRILDISNCDVIYYVIYVICSHYVGKAISPLFAWPSSYINTLYYLNICIIVIVSRYYKYRYTFLFSFILVNIAWTLQVLLNMAPNDKENPIANTQDRPCRYMKARRVM